MNQIIAVLVTVFVVIPVISLLSPFLNPLVSKPFRWYFRQLDRLEMVLAPVQVPSTRYCHYFYTPETGVTWVATALPAPLPGEITPDQAEKLACQEEIALGSSPRRFRDDSLC